MTLFLLIRGQVLITLIIDIGDYLGILKRGLIIRTILSDDIRYLPFGVD